MGMFGKQCQSCGMPLEKDPQGGGINADGSKSGLYCSYCFQNGSFTDPNLNLEQMKQKVQTKMQDMGFPKLLAKFFTLQLPRLDRWKQKN